MSYFENFDTLVSTGTSSVMPVGWLFFENGGSSTTTYTADIGTSTTGNTFSYGSASSTNRALGTLASGTTQPIIGARFVNNTPSVISSVSITFTMEQWRAGGRTTADTSVFSYGINNGSLSVGSWTIDHNLTLQSKTLGGSARGLIGNDTANQRGYTYTITGLSINVNDTLYIRWADINATGTDDGLAIDSFYITFNGGGIAPPPAISALSFTNTGQTSATINWNKPSGYVDSLFTTLVFVKAQTAVVQGTPNRNATGYLADTNFSSSSSSRYQHDTAARCIYNGDGISVNISNLNIGTSYHVLGYVVRISDSVYSSAVITNGATQSNITPPAPLASIGAGTKPLTPTRIDLAWTKNTYTDSIHTVLVFLKKGSAVNIGVPSLHPASYVSDSLFNSTSSGRYQHDTAARCIYKGDGADVYVDGLDPSSTYYAVAFVVRDADSSWSNAVTGSFSTPGLPPSPVTNLTFTGTQVTASLISWTLPAGYSQALTNVVVFAKADSAIKGSTPVKNYTSYTANGVFGIGSTLETDNQAYCVYNGDLSSFTMSGLITSKKYYLKAYVVKQSDSLYSTADTLGFFQHYAPPLSVSSVSMTGINTSSAKITWTKPASYKNNGYTTLVFVKADQAVNNGTPVKSIIRYNPSATFGSGTKLETDSLAFTVFRGDTNFVNISNLNNTKTYHISIWVVEDFDSVYSFNAVGSGSSLPPPQYYPIGSVNTVNPVTGVPDSLNKSVLLRGVVYGFNQRFTGLQFLMRDATGGIQVLSTLKNFGYNNVLEGDSVTASGLISHSRGQVQLTTLDTVILIARGKAIKNPVVVNTLNENTENDLVRLNMVKFVTPPAGNNWPTNNTNIRVIKTGTFDTLTIRIISTSAIAGTPLPGSSVFSIVGMGAQTSTSTNVPFAFDGYYIIPRTASDIIPFDSLQAFALNRPLHNTTISVDIGSITFNWQHAIPASGVANPTYTWLLDSARGNFSTPLFSGASANSGADSIFTLTNAAIKSIFNAEGVNPGQSITTRWIIKATSGAYTRTSADTFTLILTNNTNNTSVGTVFKHISFHLYPNPADKLITVEAEEKIEAISITDMSGKAVLPPATFEGNSKIKIETNSLAKGLYLLQLKTATGTGVKRLIIQ